MLQSNYARVLYLIYINILANPLGIEPRSSELESAIIPLYYGNMVGNVGFAPTTSPLSGVRSTPELISYMVVLDRLELPTSCL